MTTSNRYGPSPVAPRRRRKPLWRRALNGRTLFAIAVALALVWVLQPRERTEQANSSDTKSTPVKTKSTKLSKGTPNYKTYLPKGKSAKDYGGWTRVSPSKADPVYAYSDVIGTTPVIVSQQDLPSAFVGNVEEKVEELAQDYSAGEKITAKEVTVYVGKSADGPESIIFVKGSTLILIKTDGKLSNDDLLAYVESLE